MLKFCSGVEFMKLDFVGIGDAEKMTESHPITKLINGMIINLSKFKTYACERISPRKELFFCEEFGIKFLCCLHWPDAKFIL